MPRCQQLLNTSFDFLLLCNGEAVGAFGDWWSASRNLDVMGGVAMRIPIRELVREDCVIFCNQRSNTRILEGGIQIGVVPEFELGLI